MAMGMQVLSETACRCGVAEPWRSANVCGYDVFLTPISCSKPFLLLLWWNEMWRHSFRYLHIGHLTRFFFCFGCCMLHKLHGCLLCSFSPQCPQTNHRCWPFALRVKKKSELIWEIITFSVEIVERNERVSPWWWKCVAWGFTPFLYTYLSQTNKKKMLVWH